MSEIESVLNAIQVIFSANIPNRDLLQAANSYLAEFSLKPQSFGVSLELLLSPQVPIQVKLFASNMLYNKVIRSDIIKR
jgi:hypothetical protein